MSPAVSKLDHQKSALSLYLSFPSVSFVDFKMSFGWSAGDVISAIQLTTKIITSLWSAGGSRANFQEIETELHDLQKALLEISELTGSPEQIPEIHALKFASCACGKTLQRFYEKLKPFEDSLGVASENGKFKAAPRMVR